MWLQQTFEIHTLTSGHHGRLENIKKTRYIDMATGYHLIRVDNDNIADRPNEWAYECLRRSLDRAFRDYHIPIVLIADYRKGLLEDEDTVYWIIRQAHKHRAKIYVDSRATDLIKFTGVDVLKLNDSEFSSAKRALNASHEGQVMENLGVSRLIVTRGAGGAELHHKGRAIEAKPDLTGFTGTPDVTGCGDMFGVTFCNHWGIKDIAPEDAIRTAVQRATELAYEPIGERLYVPDV
jgi:bifunctional ADP-heptose synthase (sugar kinase/adenylyltransferase)